MPEILQLASPAEGIEVCKQYIQTTAHASFLASRSCIVLDIDDTVLFDVQNVSEPKRIELMYKFYKWMIQQRIPVYFITARPASTENSRVTVNELKSLGFGKFEELTLMPVDSTYSKLNDAQVAAYVARFKAAERYRIRDTCKKIPILNVGNKWQDICLQDRSSPLYVQTLSLSDDATYFVDVSGEDACMRALKLPSEGDSY